MHEGYSGLRIADSKQEAAELLRQSFDEEINVSKLEELGISERTIYNHFSGVGEAEEFVFGDVEYSCEICGKEFEERLSWKSHKSNCSEETHADRLKARELLEDFDTSFNFITYVMRIQRIDGEKFYYIGTTKNPVWRMVSHIRGDGISLPKVGELGYSRDIEFDVLEVIEVQGFNTNEEAKEKERLRSLEIAIEKETTNVVGGR